MSDHKLDLIHADGLIGQSILDAECDALNREKQAIIGSWQCPHCYLAAMETWREEPNPDNAPSCCGGEPMLPYRITPQTREEADRNTKIVSRWIDDIERQERMAAEGITEEDIYETRQNGAGLGD